MKGTQITYLRSLLNATMRFLPADNVGETFGTQASESLPSECRPYYMQGASVSYLEYPFGCIFSQKLIVKGYIFWYHRFNIKQRVTLHPLANILLITIHYMLRGNIPCTMNGQEVILSDNHYQVYGVAPQGQYTADFAPGNYESFHIGLPSYILPKLSGVYPDLAELGAMLNHDFKGTHYKDLFTIGSRIHECIRELLNYKELPSPTHKGKRDLYWQERVIRLVNHYVADKDFYDQQQKRLYAAGIKLGQLEEYIVENLVNIDQVSRNPFSLTVLLPLLKITVYDFKKAMLQTYQKPWSKYVYEVRMKKAMDLVLEKPYRNFNDISYKLGYSHHESFFRAFKACYHNRPGHYRKNS